MSAPLDPQPLQAAFQKAASDLLDQRTSDGHWVGELASSALSTATAISALALARQLQVQTHGLPSRDIPDRMERGLSWLMPQQNADGGWGDTTLSHSNISTTMLTVAAVHLANRHQAEAERLHAANRYVDERGRVDGLRKRYGQDKTFAVPILANCALAGLASWKEVAPLPFEMACLPQSWYRFAQLPVVSYAIPALVAIGQAKFVHDPCFWPYRLIRRLAQRPSLEVLSRMQPESGGYLEAIPLTSFVVMSLIKLGQGKHPVVQNGLRFLAETQREDGSWPIDTNLATWNTTLSVNALAGGGFPLPDLDCFDWLLKCQVKQRHPFTGAAPGGWGWSDLSGSVPDADDTPGALLALRAWYDSPGFPDHRRQEVEASARQGLRWLIDLQNRDGGWPTFCRGWGKLPFDRSGSDLTAHALRAVRAWRDVVELAGGERAMQRGERFLRQTQNPDGSWTPLWFGNQDHPQEENPVYGTAKVLMGLRDLQQCETPLANRGFQWLVSNQNPDGGWGGGPGGSSVEETALAVEGLLADSKSPKSKSSADLGLRWLVQQVERGSHQESSPIGFYFAKLWYYERLYPLIFTVSALGRALQLYSKHPELAGTATP